MNRLKLFALCCVAAAFLAFSGCAGCDKDESNPIVGQGGAGASTTTSGTGGIAGNGGAGASFWVVGDPGTAGVPFKLGAPVPFAQGLAKRASPTAFSQHVMADIHCVGQGGGAGTGGAAGAGGATGGTAGAGVGGGGICDSTFGPGTPRLDLSQINQTDLTLVIASPPIFTPFRDENGVECASPRVPITYGGLHLATCSGVGQSIAAFTAADLGPLFSAGGAPLPTNTQLYLDGSPGDTVSLVSGLAISTAIIGDSIFVATNISSILVQLDQDPNVQGAWNRSIPDMDFGAWGVTALAGLPDGKLLYANNRTFDALSLSTADPSQFVEINPLELQTYDPVTKDVTSVLSFPGGVKTAVQNVVRAGPVGSPEFDQSFIAGCANNLTETQAGDYLFSDRDTGTVYLVAQDLTNFVDLFTVPADVLISGITEAPNGIIYVVKSPTVSFNCDQFFTYPTIAYWDEQAQELVDWLVLDSAEYANLMHDLCNGVFERTMYTESPHGTLGQGIAWLGGGLFVNLSHDNLGHLIVSDTLTGNTVAIPAIPTPPPPPVGGAGGTAGAPPAGGAAGAGGN